jgi:L-amino acid N-acyltransferase YncA
MIIRVARIEDAAVLTKAEQDTAQIPGLVVSRPHELTTESFAAKITELATLGRYIVAENNERIIGHALLDPMRLEAIAHVFRLTIMVHPGYQNRGIGEALMRDLMNWAKQAPNLQKV